MNELPFTSEQFFQVFRSYNQQVWPLQLLLLAAALVTIWTAYAGTRSRLGWSLLAALWLWCGVMYQWLHFTVVNPAAYLFGALFVAQGVLLAVIAAHGSTPLVLTGTVRGILGGALVVAALVVYPLLGTLSGHDYMASPTFGLPCPLTIFTFGVLLWAQPRAPVYLLLIPVVWAVIGSSAFVAFGVWQDVLLPLGGVLAMAARVLHRRTIVPHAVGGVGGGQ